LSLGALTLVIAEIDGMW